MWGRRERVELQERVVSAGSRVSPMHTSILVRVSIVIRHHDQSNVRKKGLFWLTLPHHSTSSKGFREDLEEGS